MFFKVSLLWNCLLHILCSILGTFSFIYNLSLLEGVVSYSSPQGDILYDIDLVDDMYDGNAENSELHKYMLN